MEGIRPASGEQWVIEAGDQRAVIVEVGGGIRTYHFGAWPVLDGYAEDEVAPGGAAQILAPWPNRIRDGRYSFAGQPYALPLTEPDHHNAMHGLVRWLPWQPLRTTASSLEVTCVLPAQPGYPWTLRLTTRWSLSSDGLRAEHSATNLASASCPFGLGIHPYLSLPDTSVDDTLLAVPARTRLKVDERGLPTGLTPVAGTDYDFASARPIGPARLDTAFTDLADGNAVTLSSNGRGVRVWGDPAFRWWQVYSGDTLPEARRRRSVAVEPMTCPADAFRSGTDLITLAPGATWSAAWGISPSVH